METIMKITKTVLLCGFLALAGIAMVMRAAAPAHVRVGGYSLRANGELARGYEYSGTCPVDLKFGWSLIGPEATTATYSFTRNDGSHPPGGSVDLSPGRSGFVYLDWRLGANNPKFADYRGWVDLHVESPNPVSQRISFTLHCGG